MDKFRLQGLLIPLLNQPHRWMRLIFYDRMYVTFPDETVLIGLTGDEHVPVFAGRFPPMLLQIPCKSGKDSLRAFHCLNENLLRKNCLAPHS